MAGFPRSGWKQTCPSIRHRFPWPVPGSASGLRWPSRVIGYRPFLGVVIALPGTHAGFRLFTRHVYPEGLRSCSLLSPPSLLLRPHAPVCRPLVNFPGSPIISPALLATDLPRFDHPPFGCCRHPYAGRSAARISPTSSAATLAIAQVSTDLAPSTPTVALSTPSPEL